MDSFGKNNTPKEIEEFEQAHRNPPRAFLSNGVRFSEEDIHAIIWSYYRLILEAGRGKQPRHLGRKTFDRLMMSGSKSSLEDLVR